MVKWLIGKWLSGELVARRAGPHHRGGGYMFFEIAAVAALLRNDEGAGGLY